MSDSKKRPTIQVYTEISSELFETIMDLDEAIFETSFAREKIRQRLEGKETLTYLAFDGDQPVGMKLGYQLDDETFMSWMGGILPSYRGLGLAQEMMSLQHQELKEMGYKKVQTKTQNRFMSMLILNLKSGFEIIDTYKGDDDQLRIVLEKTL
ncbi:MAG: GNAT family N-acetyltransferase [Bdellovibrionales bacterium]|nr:GNAT family N-acetyltransferase [Bdellovibrionales bacterium]